QRIEFWRTRFPEPQTALHSSPDIAFTVLIQIEHAMAKRAILCVALDAAIPNRAEAASRDSTSCDPYRAFPILKELETVLPDKLWILSEFAVLPTGEPFRGANPKRPVARSQQAPYKVVGQMLMGWRLPGDGPDPIEAKQAKLRAQPEIAIGRLRY